MFYLQRLNQIEARMKKLEKQVLILNARNNVQEKEIVQMKRTMQDLANANRNKSSNIRTAGTYTDSLADASSSGTVCPNLTIKYKGRIPF